MPAQVRNDDRVAGRIRHKDVTPVVADAHTTVQQQKRLAIATDIVVHQKPTQFGSRHAGRVAPTGVVEAIE